VDGAPNPAALFIQANCTTGFDVGHLPSPTDPCGGPLVSIPQAHNHFRDPHYVNADFAIIKNTKLPRWENEQPGIGVQFFNVFNYPISAYRMDSPQVPRRPDRLFAQTRPEFSAEPQRA
jgi:hypothetical protein